MPPREATTLNVAGRCCSILGLPRVSLFKIWRSNMSMPGPWELVLIFLIVLLVFGAGKIPKIARDIGSGIREFKKSFDGTNDKSEDDKKTD
jgi:TatA/E family protein of Tat protein translocase